MMGAEEQRPKRTISLFGIAPTRAEEPDFPSAKWEVVVTVAQSPASNTITVVVA